MKFRKSVLVSVLSLIGLAGCKQGHYSTDRHELRQECAQVALDYYQTFGHPAKSTQELDEACSSDESRPCFPDLEVVIDSRRDVLLVKETKSIGSLRQKLSEAIIETNSPYRVTRFGPNKGRVMVVPEDENIIRFMASQFSKIDDEKVVELKCSEMQLPDSISGDRERQFKSLSVSRNGSIFEFIGSNGTRMWSATRLLLPSGNVTFQVTKGG